MVTKRRTEQLLRAAYVAARAQERKSLVDYRRARDTQAPQDRMDELWDDALAAHKAMLAAWRPWVRAWMKAVNARQAEEREGA